MPAPLVARHGAWASPLSPAALATASATIDYARAQDGRLYWIEKRPDDGGRNVLLTLDAAGNAVEVVPPPFNLRSRVHEYGGMPFVHAGTRLLFCHFADQRLYLADAGATGALTPPCCRYADGAASADGRRVFFVREDHRAAGEPRNAIVAIDPAHPSAGTPLYGDADFVAHPRPSPDGRRLAFVSWDHPQMPWDGSRLHVGALAGDALHDLQTVAGGPAESVLDPQWDDDGTLYFLSDRSGWWNLYRWRGSKAEAVTSIEAELGLPLWQLGDTNYALLGNGRALVRVTRDARDTLAIVDLADGRLAPLRLPYVAYRALGRLDARTAFAIAAADDAMPELIAVDVAGGGHRVVRRGGNARPLPAEFVSRAEAIEYPTAPAADGAARRAHAFFYPPRNPGYTAPAGERPPLIVLMHGGPTAHRPPNLNLHVQFWTTRGVAVVDVNHGGSSGFGRAYRDRLRGQWGVVDLADAVAAVRHLVDAGRVDGRRVVIRGGSAGGFTVLSALAFTDLFAAGINYFGIADLETLAGDTHKFESRYLDGLVAPLPAGRAVYRARSPLHHLQRMNAALLTLQGAEDRVVPPAQSQAIVAAVRARGRPVAYIEFEGEQHGFRRAPNIRRALEAELYFLGRVLGFAPADPVEPLPIDNLPPA